jgi:hypothetical protein
MPRPLRIERPSVGRSSDPKTYSQQNASNGLSAATLMVGQRLTRQAVEFSKLHVALEFAIPNVPVVLGKPGTKAGELVGGELPYLSLNLFDSVHRKNILPRPLPPA